METVNNKECVKCHTVYPLTDFYTYVYKGIEKHRSDCRYCSLKRSYKHREDNIEHYKERERNYYENNRQKKINSAKEWATKNKDRRKEIVNKYDSSNRDILNEKARVRYKSDNHTKYRLLSWRLNNPDKLKKYRKTSYDKNQIKYRQYTVNRRSLEKQAEGKITKEDILKQLDNQGNLCYYCLKSLKSYHVDHYIPLSKGGTNWPSNIVIACSLCNNSKHDKMPDDYYEWLVVNGRTIIGIT